MEPSSQSSLEDGKRAKDAKRKREERAKRTAVGDAAPKRPPTSLTPKEKDAARKRKERMVGGAEQEARRAADAKRKREQRANRAAFGHVLSKRQRTFGTPRVVAAQRNRKRRTEVAVEQVDPIPSGDGPTVRAKRGRPDEQPAAPNRRCATHARARVADIERKPKRKREVVMEQVDPTPHVRDQNCRSRVQERASRIRVENRTDRQQERDRTGRVQTGRMQVDQTQEHVDRVWGQRGASNNRDHTRADVYSNLDHPYQRFCADYELRRAATDEMVRRWESQPVESGPIQCMLCSKGVDFLCREDWLRHLDEKHGGRQRYRDACLSFAQLAPQVVSGQEWRAIVANFTEFYTRAATDWEKFTPCMQKACSAGQQIAPDMRWAPRQRIGCVFCARSHWLEDLHAVYLAGEQSFVRCPSQVWKMLSVERYKERWPLIAATKELEASVVTISG